MSRNWIAPNPLTARSVPQLGRPVVNATVPFVI
jgi:hypothetical protein